MEIEILYPGAYPLARVALQSGEEITAESGAMVSMSPTLELKAEARGGLLKSLGRKLLAGESFFQSTVTANDAGEILLAPGTPGDLLVLDAESGWLLQKGAFLAAGDQVELSTVGQGFGKGLFSREGFFVLRAEGTGQVILSSYGAIHRIELEAGQEHIVDNGHLVAWNCEYEIRKAAKGWVSSFTTGEGLVCRFEGPGSVYIQTRNLGPLAQSLIPFLPRQRSSS